MVRQETMPFKQKVLLISNIFFIFQLIFFAPAGSMFGADVESSALPDAFNGEDLLWEIKLGIHQYTIPVIDNGQIFIGTDDRNLDHPAVKQSGGGILMCLEQSSGEMIWQLPIPRYIEGTEPPYHFNHWKCGVCSRPAVEGERLYFVSPRGDVLCLDRNGQADGNDKPFVNETEYMGIEGGSDYQLTARDGDIIWRFNMIEELSVVPHDVCGSTPLLHGDYLYVCTSNGMDDTHKNVANPSAPSVIVLNKDTGKLVATDGELIGKRMFHGHWSSPTAATIDGQDIIFFGGGDGVLYAFEAFEPADEDASIQKLKKIWQYDCNPQDYRIREGKKITYSSWDNNSPDGPSEIIATPIVYNDRVYVAIGQSPIHGPGKGLLSCVDAKTGTKIWESRQVDRSLCNAVIQDGLLFIADFSGRLHCFDADTGELYWQHELEAGTWSASPFVTDGKVYISTEKNVLWVLEASREKKLLSRSRMKSMAITPTVHDGVFYLPTQKRLFAIKTGNSKRKSGQLDFLLDDISPDIKKWATIVLVEGEKSNPSFEWLHYRDSEDAVDFWPASTIKIYTVVAALEYINELGLPTDCVVAFERKNEGQWILDSARTMREMISEVFRRSSNEDYTLLLRFVGIDRINTKFLIPEKGFGHSALMRDYITYRPPLYVNEEPQRITIYSKGKKPVQVEHSWSGISYAERRGATVISSTTGNCTSTRELAECMRRIMFHHFLPESERYNLTDEQVDFVINGGDGLTGLANKEAGPYAWKNSTEKIFPNAKFFHKGGLINTYSLDVAYIEDDESNSRFIVVVAAESGDTTTVTEMAKRIAEWIQNRKSEPPT